MSEKEQTSKRNQNKSGEKAAAPLGVGELLKQEREKKGLSREQVSEMTRLRVHILKALEGEVWEELPPPVFVRGFIRSYARILDLDEKVALDGYEDHATVGESMPQPLTVDGGPRRGWILFLPVILCGLGLLLYLWIGFPMTDKVKSPPERRTAPKLQERERRPPEKSGKPTREPAKEAETVSSLSPPVAPPEPPPQPEVDEPVVTEQAPGISQEALVLNGHVKMRTWVRVEVDGQGPKEYIFQPGARPQWRAKKGFDIMVGNAAGIVFELDGKEIKDLGELGEVVRLKLPEEADRTGGGE